MEQTSRQRQGTPTEIETAILNAMIFQYTKTSGYRLLVVFIGMHSPVLLAEIYDISELQQPDTTAPAMTGFYNVSPRGVTTPEDPLESGFATSAGSDFDPEHTPEEEPDTDPSGKNSEEAPGSEKKTRERRRILIRVKRKSPERDLASRFQCERHGFYYTNDGRCVAPAYGYGNRPLIPQPLPGRDMPTRGRINGNMLRLDQ